MPTEEIILDLQRCADVCAGMEIKNDDGTYTQISTILYQAAEKLNSQSLKAKNDEYWKCEDCKEIFFFKHCICPLCGGLVFELAD